jgi:glycosyltransferase involved in cell wall biosynthesis
MQFGAPTITTTSSSVPEVAGDAAILLDPKDTEGWAQAMLRLAASRSERDALSEAAVQQAKRFEWQRSAAHLLQLYEEALASPKRGVAV